MKKIPTMFVRDWNGDRSRVTPEVTPGCEWVVAGEGRALQKLDGTCCMIRSGVFYKRREIKMRPSLHSLPAGFEPLEADPETGALVGWIPVGDGPEDRPHMEAFARIYPPGAPAPADGTYELVGPKVQGNPEGVGSHVLIRHADIREWEDVPRTFDGLAAWFATRPGIGGIEGIVFHHSDGRMAKIKSRDFGFKREA